MPETITSNVFQAFLFLKVARLVVRSFGEMKFYVGSAAINSFMTTDLLSHQKKELSLHVIICSLACTWEKPQTRNRGSAY